MHEQRRKLRHQPCAPWCELCISNRSQQDPHPVRRDESSSAHSTVSFDFGFAARTEDEHKAYGLFIHDQQTGAMHVVPTPQKGGRHLQYLCAEFCGFLVWLGYTTVGLRCDQEPATLSLLEAAKKTCRGLGIRVMEETAAPGSHASNGAAEVTVKVLRRHANLLVQQIEKGCGIGDVIGCHHPLYQWALLNSAWLHNRFVVRHGKTAYELCTSRQYTGRLAMFGGRRLGFLKLSTKGSPTWTRGIWLGKTMSNDVHILAVPGHPQLFFTRFVRRLPNAWDMQMIAGMEACPWQFGYASLGAQLVLAKRIAAPPIFSLPPAKPRGCGGRDECSTDTRRKCQCLPAPEAPNHIRLLCCHRLTAPALGFQELPTRTMTWAPVPQRGPEGITGWQGQWLCHVCLRELPAGDVNPAANAPECNTCCAEAVWEVDCATDSSCWRCSACDAAITGPETVTTCTARDFRQLGPPAPPLQTQSFSAIYVPLLLAAAGLQEPAAARAWLEADAVLATLWRTTLTRLTALRETPFVPTHRLQEALLPLAAVHGERMLTGGSGRS